MYQIENVLSLMRWPVRLLRRASGNAHIDRNVVFLGITSFFTDISSEMVATVLPLYILYGLHLSPLQLGIVDGLYQGSAALIRLIGGVLADRWRRYKAVCFVGYAVSAICRLGLFFISTSATAVGGWVVADRMGKGLRTAPRDALIALSSESANLAAAFGVHRSFDAAGAMLGPLFAFFILQLVPGAFDAIFLVSFCFALMGLTIIWLLVEERNAPKAKEGKPCKSHHHEGHPAVRCRNCRAAPAIPPGASLADAVRALRNPQFVGLAVIGTVLGFFTLSDSFLFLQLQRRIDLGVGAFPLLYVATSFVYMVLAVPVGRLADRVGRRRVFLLGYAFMLSVYLLLFPDLNMPPSVLLGAVLLLGAYYAATDGVLMALASGVLPELTRASGLALLASLIGLARLCSSVLFGAFWKWLSAELALQAFAIGMFVATLAAAVVLRFLRVIPVAAETSS
jgi:MFS family permease